MKKYINIAIVVLMLTGILFSCSKSESLPSVKDIYLAGYETDGSSVFAKYWKNRTPVTLTDGRNSAEAFSIAVYGKDVYVSGYERAGKINVAKYWKNNIAFSLTDAGNPAGTSSICVGF